MYGRVRIWLDGVRDLSKAFGNFLEVFSQFGLKIAISRKPMGSLENLQDITERKMEGVGGDVWLRECGICMEWSEKMTRIT